MCDPRIGRHVEQARYPDRRVDGEARQRASGVGQPELRYVVDEDDRIGHVRERIADAASHRLRRRVMVENHARSQERSIDGTVEMVQLSIGVLPRVGVCAVRRRRNRNRRS